MADGELYGMRIYPIKLSGVFSELPFHAVGSRFHISGIEAPCENAIYWPAVSLFLPRWRTKGSCFRSFRYKIYCSWGRILDKELQHQKCVNMEELKCAYDSSESGSDREESPTEPAEKRAKGELRCNKEAANVTHSGNSKCQRPIQEQQGKLGAVGSGGIEHSNRFSVPPSSAEGHVAGGGIFRPVGRSYHSAAQWGAGERTQPRKELPAPSTAATRSSEAPKSEHCDSKIRRYIPKRLREKAASSHGSAVTGPVRVGDLGITEETRNAEQSRTEQLSPVSNVPSRANRPPKKVLVRFSGHTKGVNCVRWCPQKANLLLSASMDHSIHLWDIHSRQSVEKLECHGGSVKAAQWSHCGTKVLSCGYDKMARITNIQTGQSQCYYVYL